jgi:hypothetical protein
MTDFLSKRSEKDIYKVMLIEGYKKFEIQLLLLPCVSLDKIGEDGGDVLYCRFFYK